MLQLNANIIKNIKKSRRELFIKKNIVRLVKTRQKWIYFRAKMPDQITSKSMAQCFCRRIRSPLARVRRRLSSITEFMFSTHNASTSPSYTMYLRSFLSVGRLISRKMFDSRPSVQSLVAGSSMPYNSTTLRSFGFIVYCLVWIPSLSAERVAFSQLWRLANRGRSVFHIRYYSQQIKSAGFTSTVWQPRLLHNSWLQQEWGSFRSSYFIVSMPLHTSTTVLNHMTAQGIKLHHIFKKCGIKHTQMVYKKPDKHLPFKSHQIIQLMSICILRTKFEYKKIMTIPKNVWFNCAKKAGLNLGLPFGTVRY